MNTVYRCKTRKNEPNFDRVYSKIRKLAITVKKNIKNGYYEKIAENLFEDTVRFVCSARFILNVKRIASSLILIGFLSIFSGASFAPASIVTGLVVLSLMMLLEYTLREEEKKQAYN